MKYASIIIILTSLISLSFIVNERTDYAENRIAVNWVSEFKKDFSFKNEWSYPEGVYRNKFGQLSCDGICPPETDRMKDHNGRIYPDSLHAFYQIVDTTHLFHSITSEASAYEWAGTNFIEFKRNPDNSIIGQTKCNAGTHSSLNIKIINDSLTAWIDYNSIAGHGRHTFQMKQGKIKIDKQHFGQGIIKAEFDMTFVNTLDMGKKMYWKGLIYSKITK